MGGDLKRIPQREILDGDTESPEAVLESLEDLRLVNRWFGGVRTTALLLRRAMSAFGLRSASVLEVAAGDGFSIVRAAERLRKEEGLDVRPVCMDRRQLHGQVHCCERAVVGDALELAFPPESFDFVSCGLFVHHLAPAEVIAFVNGALAVARRAVLINDLRRSSLHLALVYASMPIFRSPISRFDSVASVKQAYTPDELRELMRQTKAAGSEICMRYLFRMGAIVWK
jgi:2-polyprenyl-3-methyl-5-hydroxy-6-metoxy-1,4-benzoquinol methylase